MTDNLEQWNKFADVDPKFTKAITGKPYKGTSPNPQYVIRCLTEMFGPVGQGFGWKVIAEDFRELGGETLHWCRIEFWHTDRANVVESYGQTKAAYMTHGGKQMVDEDAPKKSLTDAIIKAASWVGIGANIFLGRWDDQKYVAQVEAEFKKADQPPFDAENTRDRIKAKVGAAPNSKALEDLWGHPATKEARARLSEAMQGELLAAYRERAAYLFQAPDEAAA